MSFSTNSAASTALQTLQMVNKQIGTTTERVSTGNAINSAKDNPAYWSVAMKAESDISGMEAVTSALGYAAGYLDVALTGVELARTKLQDARAVLVGASSTGADFTVIDTAMRGFIDDAMSAVNNSNYNGSNLLTSNSAVLTSVTFAVALDDGSGAPATLSLATSSLTMLNGTTAGKLDAVAAAYKTGGTVASITTAALATTAIAAIDTAIDDLLTAEGLLGAAANRIDSQKTFNMALIDVQKQAVASLVSADLEAESARLQSLQTQQALAIEALSIANNQSANILALFR